MTKTKKHHREVPTDLVKQALHTSKARYVGELSGGGPILLFQIPALRVQWVARMTIDCDGSGGNPDDDPYYQSETSLCYRGKSLNAYKVPFIVVPPLVVGCCVPIVLGCQGMIVNLTLGLSTPAVVGDVGPSSKIGEASCEAAYRVGLSSNPNFGGTQEQEILYMIWPGIAAVVDKIEYDLQAS